MAFMLTVRCMLLAIPERYQIAFSQHCDLSSDPIRPFLIAVIIVPFITPYRGLIKVVCLFRNPENALLLLTSGVN